MVNIPLLGIGNRSRFWQTCLGPLWYTYSHVLFHNLAFHTFDYQRTIETICENQIVYFYYIQLMIYKSILRSLLSTLPFSFLQYEEVNVVEHCSTPFRYI